MEKRDAHIHTPFCPHGSKDALKQYVEKALERGFDSITFTEHAPLPPSFQDPVPLQDSAMDLRQMEVYLERLSQLKKEYDGQISILTGLETDFITGYEEETAAFLNTYGPSLDDGILSVHFLKTGPSYICLDFDEHAFQQLADRFGSVEAVYEQYYETVYSSIVTPLGPFKPKRVGHITLVKKFARLFPYSMSPQIRELAARCLDAVKEHGMELDVNTSGLRKKFAGEVYMEDWMAETAKQKKIPLIFGSDAHQAEDVGSSYETYKNIITS
ncbi:MULTISPECIES: histidinol-phosphatase HisJ [Bacillus]|jgi:histidinol-phosphatase (PHP family)|uniref:Histidinol-phosphatase n=1 Tax=Bacillus velezensis TaxID=492670 RepID=A0A411A9B2_BACVE|nr:MULTISPECIES: histidinol-phosphatase HisJ [Bacillus]AJK66383.1 putative histidinol phosphate phosphatase [Bacillus amyloliquefaciens KHG19]ANB84690.1 histidinol phosphatase [Bacillus velezensis]ASB54199.1 Histidinol-phosphatase [Bacillus velezensis]ASB66580.1 Histidinol-phosphatase [Bacillus velezensis]ATV01888.1 histidinol phosphatase [Bacillus velezensis]